MQLRGQVTLVSAAKGAKPAEAERAADLSRVDIRVGRIVQIGPVSTLHHIYSVLPGTTSWKYLVEARF